MYTRKVLLALLMLPILVGCPFLGLPTETGQPTPSVGSEALRASFTATPPFGPPPLTVAFDGSASTGPVVIYMWSFGDGTTAMGQRAEHTYNAPGDYDVTLTLIGPTNQRVQTTQTVSALRPLASMTVTPARLNFGAAGQSRRLTVIGTLPGGTTLDLNESVAKPTYTSSNTAVAAVDPSGLVTAQGLGSAEITVNYVDQFIETVPVSVEPLMAGAAMRVITPVTPAGTPLADPDRAVNHAHPVYIAGFGNDRQATDVHDDLWARAIALRRNGVTIVLVAVDLVGYFNNEIEIIRSLIDPALGVDYLVVASTHTHQGPDTLGLWGPDDFTTGIDPGYLDFVNEAIVAAVEEAAGDLRQARVKFATANTAGVSLGTDPEDDGFGVADTGVLVGDGAIPGNIDGRIVDPDLVSMQLVDSSDSTTIATLASFASHPESVGSNNTRVSSDFCHYVRQRLEQAYGGISVFVVADIGAQQGPLDIDVLDPETGAPALRRTFRFAEVLGEALADRAINALDGVADYTIDPSLDFRVTHPLFLPLENPFFRHALATGTISTRRVLFTDGNPDPSVEPDPVFGLTPIAAGAAMRSEVGTFRVGDTAFIVVPNELDPQIGNTYKESFPSARHKFIVGLGNDEVGYEIPGSKLNTAFYDCYFHLLNDVPEQCPEIANVSTPTYVVNNLGRDHEPTVTGALTPLISALNEGMRTGQVNPPPPVGAPVPGLLLAVFGATPSEGPAPLTVTFDATASLGLGTDPIRFDWDFGDAATGSGRRVEHEYSEPGQYTASLTVTDDQGSTNTSSATITVLLGLDSLTVTPSPINFAALGQQIQLAVMGQLAEGGTTDLTDGDLGTTYEIEDTNIATVTADGLVTSVAEGKTTLTVTYGRRLTKTVPINVAVLLAGASALPITPVTPPGTPLANPEREVNHTDPVFIAGFGNNRRATGVHDVTWARSLVLRHDGVTIAIVSLDVVGYGLNFVEEIRLLLEPDRVDFLVVTSTHNHEGADTIGIWGPDDFTSGVDLNYIDFVNAQVVASIEQAVAALKPAKVRFAIGSTVGVSTGDDPEDDGLGVADTKVLAGDDATPGNIDGRIVETTLPIMQLVNQETNEAIATYVSFSNHPECVGSTSTLVSSDYPHYMRQRIEAAYGGIAIYAAGAVGVLQTPLRLDVIDPDTGNNAQRRTFRWSQLYGEALGDKVIQALQAGGTFSAFPKLDYRVTKDIDVPLDNPYFRVAFAIGVLPPERQLYTDGAPVNGLTVDPVLGQLPVPIGEDLRTEVAAVRVGEMAFIVCPSELDPQIGFQYQNVLTNARFKAITGLGNDHLGYQLQAAKWDDSCHACGYYDLAGVGHLCPVSPTDCNTVFINNVGQGFDPAVTGAMIPLLTDLNASYVTEP